MAPKPQYNRVLLELAGNYLGLKEYPGAQHNETVVDFFQTVGHGWVDDDETPWCAAFVGAVLSTAGLTHTGKLNAKSYLDWGEEISMADVMPGDVVILTRGDPDGPYGHVGFVRSIEKGQVRIRGGNQGNAVTDSLYDISRVIGWRRATTSETGGTAVQMFPTLRKGMKNSIFVEEAQQYLAALGFAPGPIDGDYGRLMFQATTAFQEANSLRVDGIIGPKTWDKLRDPNAIQASTRDVTIEDLREGNSGTIKEADKLEKMSKGFGGGGGISSIAKIVQDYVGQVSDPLAEASRLQTWQNVLLDNWLIVLIGIGGVVLYIYGPKVAEAIRQRRLEDARLGKHSGTA